MIQVEVTFEGNRFSQAISNFGELSIIERDEAGSSSNSNVASDPPSLTSVSSSSRESSPAVNVGIARGRENSPRVVTMGGITTRDLSPAGPDRATAAGRGQPSLDSALVAIGLQIFNIISEWRVSHGFYLYVKIIYCTETLSTRV
jgi:hypothetical protein